MKKEKTHKELFLPALRAKMGDWIYYISFMRMKDVAERVDIAADIHESKSLNELLQRAVTSRTKEITKYLVTQEQRFFNSIIIGVYGGSPQWYELEVKENDKFDSKSLPDYLEGAIGYLKLNGEEDLFAIDGQHRAYAITEAVREKESLHGEDVSVIFVSAKQDASNRQRTRRLFSTLNRNAKAVKPRDIVALDEDDTIAIVTRKMINDYALFKNDRINIKVLGKSIPPNDNKCITTIVSLYDILDIILQDKSDKEWKGFLSIRPDDKTIALYYKKAVAYWNGLQKYFKELKLIKDNKLEVINVRHQNGGHLLFRPIGLQIITEAVKQLRDNGIPQNVAIRRISKINLQLSDKPWAGVLWESIKQRMITKKENKDIAWRLTYYMAKGDLSRIKYDKDKLKRDYGSAINWDREKINQLSLPHRIGEQ